MITQRRVARFSPLGSLVSHLAWDEVYVSSNLTGLTIGK